MTKARNIADLGSNDVIETTATGVDVTGTVTADGLTVDGISSINSTNPRLRFFESDTVDLNTQIENNQGKFSIQSLNDAVTIAPKRFTIDHSTGDVSFYEDTGTTAKMVWDASAEKLTIDGSEEATSLSTAVTGSVLELNGNSGGSAASWFGSVSGGGQYVQSSNSSGTTSYDFLINPYGGNVGIGTASPASKLELSGIGTGVWLTLDRQDTNTNIIDFTETGTRLGYVGYVGDNLIINNAKTSSTTFNIANAEKMRLDSSGNLLVGTTSQVGSYSGGVSAGTSVSLGGGTNSWSWFVGNGDNASAVMYIQSIGTANHEYCIFATSTGAVGSITSSATTTFFNTSSDERLKENIVDTTHSVNIDDIRVREYDWKADGSHQRYGFIAQELETVYPEAVTSPKDEDEMKSVDYSKLVPLLVKEIQTLKARIETLENK